MEKESQGYGKANTSLDEQKSNTPLAMCTTGRWTRSSRSTERDTYFSNQATNTSGTSNTGR